MNNLELFVQVALACLLIILAAKLAGAGMRFLKQPAVVGEMIAGVLLGPTLFGQLFPGWSEALFPDDIQPVLFILSNIGLSFYMFLVGMEMDLNLFNKPLLIKSGRLTLAALAFPFAGGALIALSYNGVFGGPGQLSSAALSVFFGTAFAITAFPMLARILQEKGIVRTELGSIALLSAGLQDVCSWVLLSFVVSLAMGRSLGGGFVTLGGAFLFAIGIWWVIRPLLRILGKKVENSGQMEPSVFSWIVIALLAAALITDRLGLYSVFGGFVLGIAMPRVPAFTEAIKVRLYDIMVVFLLPLFFAYSGLNTDLSGIFQLSLLLPALALLAVAMLTKLLPVFLVMRSSGYHSSDATALAALMNARGLMVLIIANIGLTYQLINRDAFSVLVLLAVLSTLMAMPLFEWAQRKK
jgi:Kef-type K+ transport system membrane component KefB